MLRYLTAGESHGQALVVIVEGLPSNLPVTVADIASELARRRLGFGRGPRQKFEQDEIELIGGIRGLSEETTTGVHRLYQMHENG
ncbi:MAG: chorismate synthase, partial [Actinobacteria bacterium]|nr:chorismate synthase [Actinomycetota bacterium]